MKPIHDDIIGAKEVYIQLSFERYQGKLVLQNLSASVYIPHLTVWILGQHA